MNSPRVISDLSAQAASCGDKQKNNSADLAVAGESVVRDLIKTAQAASCGDKQKSNSADLAAEAGPPLGTVAREFLETETLPLWYAVRTRSNQENTVANFLTGKNLQPYVPSVPTVRQRADRKVTLQRPLFPGYVFCRFSVQRRLPILITPGVVSILSFGAEPTPIPEAEIDAIRKALASGQLAEPCPFLREGQRIRVTSGSMEGVEGILLSKKSHLRLVVSIELLQRSLAVEVDASSIESI